MATTRDIRFDAHVQLDGQYAVDYPVPRREPSIDALYSRWQSDVTLLQSQFGRRLSKDELRAAAR